MDYIVLHFRDVDSSQLT
ncbi:Protein of unknown function [Gryllus bimaculatus]|nr:Protein of unknown function [Gryllus bimaculatus]